MHQTNDHAAAGIQVADDVSHILVGDNNGNLHDGLHKCGACLFAGVLKCHGTGHLKGHFGRVDLVIRSVVKSDLNVNYRIACKNAGLHSALDTCVDCGDVFLGNNTAGDGVDKFIALAGVGLDLDLNVVRK